MEFYLGLVAAGLIGISLGLIGSGGSILTVPLLVYWFGIDPSRATAYSLFIVGVTSLTGALISMKRKEVELRAAILFSLPCFLSVYSTRRYLLPLIPDPVIAVSSFSLGKNMFIMILLLSFMMIAGMVMIVNAATPSNNNSTSPVRAGYILTTGLVVGPVTAFVGIGGGFLIVPSLVIFSKMPMKKAVGTSLTIIAAKSLFGFIGDIQSGLTLDVDLIGWITGLALVGMIVGVYMRQYIDLPKLKYVFGYFVIVLASLMLANEIVKA